MALRNRFRTFLGLDVSAVFYLVTTNYASQFVKISAQFVGKYAQCCEVRFVSLFLFSVLRKILLMEALRRTYLKFYIRSVSNTYLSLNGSEPDACFKHLKLNKLNKLLN